MAKYEDYLNLEPKRYASKPYPMVEDNEIYGWVGDGWYMMDENGMLCNNRHDTLEEAKTERDRIKAVIAARI